MSFALNLGKAPAASPCGSQRFTDVRRAYTSPQTRLPGSPPRRPATRSRRSYSALVERASAAAATARSTALTSRTAPVSAEVAIAA